MVCQISGILKLVMADGLPIKQVKFQKNPKGTSTPSKGCVCQKLKKSMHGLPSSAPETKCGHPDAGRTDGRTDGWPDGHPRRRQYPPPDKVKTIYKALIVIMLIVYRLTEIRPSNLKSGSE